MQKVWFRTNDGWWYATLREDGRRAQIRLVKAPDDRHGKKLAEDQLLQELAARNYSQQQAADEPLSPSWLTVRHVIDGFLAHSREEHKPGTYGWYKTVLSSFKDALGKLRVARLRRKAVRAWLKSTGYNPTSQNKALGAVQAALNWAVEEEHVPRNPIARMKKPTPHTRDRTLTPDEKNLILTSIRDEAFRGYVRALMLTGCRPGEVARVTAADVNLDAGVWVLKEHKTAKKTGKPRVVYLCPEAAELTRELVAANPTGPLFRSAKGRPWTRNAVRIRFRRLREKHPGLKGVVAYTCRSSFATDALEAGVPEASVATLLGHTNTDVLHKHYARLSHRVTHLREAAEKATRPRAAPAGPPDGSTADPPA